LIGAFNHIAYFHAIPTPDTASSFKERQRLFDGRAKAGTSYDDEKTLQGRAHLITATEKSLQLTPEIQ
jgi:glutamate dehydrogenase